MAPLSAMQHSIFVNIQPYWLDTMKKVIFGILGLVGLCSFAFQQPRNIFQLKDSAFTVVAQDSMPADLQREMERLGREMEKLGNVMEAYGKEMETHGAAMERGEGDHRDHVAAMDALGKKMEKQGHEMEKLGKVMEKYGQEMERRHTDMMAWFFNALKKDGLIPNLNCKISLFMENETMILNGKTVEPTLFQQYKKGLEARWGQPFKSDYAFFFKGEIKENGKGGIDMDGNMNTNF